MTAAMSLDQRRLNRAEQVEHLRRKMAAVSGKVGGGRRGAAPSSDLLPDSESLLPVPESLAELLRLRCRAGRWRCCRAPGRCC